MERCPSCRARCDGNETCRRCGMDLATLIAVERAAERLTLQGAAYLAADDPVAAGRDLTRALGLCRTPLAELLLGFARKLEAGRDETSIRRSVSVTNESKRIG